MAGRLRGGSWILRAVGSATAVMLLFTSCGPSPVAQPGFNGRAEAPPPSAIAAKPESNPIPAAPASPEAVPPDSTSAVKPVAPAAVAPQPQSLPGPVAPVAVAPQPKPAPAPVAPVSPEMAPADVVDSKEAPALPAEAVPPESTPILGTPAAAGAAPPAAAPAPGLRYAWKVGLVYECQFTVEASIGDRKPAIRGSVTYQPTDLDPQSRDGEPLEGEGSGTAFAVTPGGVLVTCAHVVRGAKEIEVHFGARKFGAKVMAFDTQRDLALLKIAPDRVPAIPLGDSTQIQIGQDVRAVGFPLSDVLGESIKVTRGTIAGIVQRSDGKLFQIDAGINPGNSGGPLVDSGGRVVGVTNALLHGESIERVGFAIPSEETMKLLRQHKVRLAVAGPPENLDGPELVRRVSPSVALVKVRFGPGGVGASERRVVRFFGSYRLERGAGDFAGDSDHDNGSLVVDTCGEVESYEGSSKFPLLFDPLGKIGIERLPGDGRKQWSNSRAVAVVQREESLRPDHDPFFDSPRYRPPLYPGPRRYRPPSLRGPPSSYLHDEPRESRVTVLPALEEVQYELDAEAADGTATIRKTYRMATLHSKGEPASLEFKGSGTITWDKKQGMTRRSTFKGTLSNSEKNVTVRVPLTLTYQVTQKDVSQTVYAAPSGGASGKAERRDPVRKIAPPAGQTPPTPSAVEQAPSSGGLNLFDPDDSGAAPRRGSKAKSPSKKPDAKGSSGGGLDLE